MSLFSKKAYVGLDIGHHALKAVQVERTPTGWHIARSITAPTPDDTVRDGVVIDPVLLGLAIKNMLKAGHIHASSAAIAISGGTVVVRPVRMPKMAESALRKSIRFEASRYVPNSVEDSYIEFEIIGDADATNMDVIIAAAPKELVDSRIQACENAGLEVEHVEVAAFAAYRSVIEADLSYDWSDKTLGLVDIGASVTNLGVISNGAFSMTRAIPAGGQVLTDALKSYFKLSDEDAESGKSQLDVRGLMNEHAVAENPPLRVLHTHVDDLVREVRRSINYWQSQQSEGATAKRMDSIILFGGGANLPGLAEYFEHKLGIPTEAKGLYQNPRFVGAQTESNRGMDIAVAVGLSMGLAPAKAVVRNPRPAVAVSDQATTPPKAPKPPKPTKGKTFKVSRKVADSAMDAPAETHEKVEVAAVAATQTIESVPQAFQPKPPPVKVNPPVEEEPTLAVEHIVEQPIVIEEPASSSESLDKYGPELAALLGEAPAEAPTVKSEEVELAEHRLEMAALLEAADAAFDSAPVKPIVDEAPAPTAEAISAPPAQISAPTVSAAPETTTAPSEMAALLDAAKPSTSVVELKQAKASLFSKFAKPEKSAKAEKPTKEAKVKQLKQPKVARETVEASEPGIKSKLAAGVSWMFGSPKSEHVKPTGVLNPMEAPPVQANQTASAPEIELLRGADLDAIDATLREAKPAPTANPPAAKVLLDAGETAKAKPKKAATTKKLQDSESSKTQKKEAA